METTLFTNKEDHFISTGFPLLDDVLGGFRSSGLYTLGGAPSIGKTTLALSIIKQIADRNIPLGIFTYEMTGKQIVNRLIAMETSIPLEKISVEKDLFENEYSQIQMSLSKFQKLPIFIESSPRLKIDELVIKARELKEKSNIEFLFIDDIQRIPIDDFSRGYASNREQEISANVRELKRLARELNIPILIISQLNRLIDARIGEKLPILIDLRDSGAIENDSDVVMFLYRAEHYGVMEDEMGDSNSGIAQIIVAKNRHGRQDSIKISYESRIPIFKILDTDNNVKPSKVIKSIMNSMDESDFNSQESPF